MSANCILISSEDELEIQIKKEQGIEVEWNHVKQCAEGVVYISSSEDDIYFTPKMKSDPEELPRIHFPSREARINKHRHKHRRRSDEKKQNLTKVTAVQGTLEEFRAIDKSFNSSYDEPPRIPPLPDLSLFNQDSRNDNMVFSVPTPERPKSKKSMSARKKRQSIEALRSKERELRGDLFAIDKESSDSDCYVTGTRNKFGDFVKNIRLKKSKDANDKLQKSTDNQPDKNNRNTKDGNKRVASSSVDLESTDNKHKAKDSRYEIEKEKSCAKRKMGVSDSSCMELSSLIKGLSSEKRCDSKSEELGNSINRKLIFPVQKSNRRDTDKSDTCHQISSRSGPFELLKHLDRSYKNELENLQISPRCRKAMKGDCVPVVKILSPIPQADFNHNVNQIPANLKGNKHQRESVLDKFRVRKPFLDENYNSSSESESDTFFPNKSRRVVKLSTSSESESDIAPQVPKPRFSLNQSSSSESDSNKIQVKKPRCVLRLSSNSGSESDSGKSRRHFTDVFSDISEAETDIDAENVDSVDDTNKTGDTTVTFNENFYNESTEIISHNDTLNQISIDSNKKVECKDDHDLDKERNVSVRPVDESNESNKAVSLSESFYLPRSQEGSDVSFKSVSFLKCDQFSDISEDEEKQKRLSPTDHVTGNVKDSNEINAFLNVSLDHGDNSDTSTLVGNQEVEDISVINISSDEVDTIPVLENSFEDVPRNSVPKFEMPILEKYTEVYSSFRSGLVEQEVLPDLSDNENDENGNEMMGIEMTESVKAESELSDKTSSNTLANENSEHCDNLFTKISLRPTKSLVSFSSTSPFVPVSPSTSKSKSPIPSLRPSESEVLITSPKQCSTPKSRKRKIIRKSATCPSFSNSRTFSSPIPSTSNMELLPLNKQMDQLTNILEDFLDLKDNKLPLIKIPDAQKSIIHSCEEEGILNLGHALNFMEHFCKKYIITSDLCNDIIKAAFYSECKLPHIHWTFNLLSKLNTRRRAEIEIKWDTINHCLTEILSPNREKPYRQLLQASLLLQLGVEVLKTDLYSRDVSDNKQIRKTYAYKMFAYDVSTTNRKNLMHFLNRALHAGQCQTITHEETFQLPYVLPLLQDLFALCVDVSSSCIDCANMLAADMVNTYKFLHNMADKQLLIKSVSCHLLRFKLVQQVLESQYDCNQILGGAFPDCLEDVIQCYFKVMPLKNVLTPPTTPNDDLHGVDEGQRYAVDATEEIAILLYFTVLSYLQTSKEKLYMALRLRVNMPSRKKKLREEDEIELGNMKDHVQDLEEHLRGMSLDLSENTEHYLFLMSCLGDLAQTALENTVTKEEIAASFAAMFSKLLVN